MTTEQSPGVSVLLIESPTAGVSFTGRGINVPLYFAACEGMDRLASSRSTAMRRSFGETMSYLRNTLSVLWPVSFIAIV